MRTFVNAVITGFGLSLGKLIFEKARAYLDPTETDKQSGEQDYIDVDADGTIDDDATTARAARFIRSIRSVRT